LSWQQSVEEVVPVVLVIIILVAWAVILGPGLVKRRARSGGDQSISHFHHQLRILEHSAPEPLVAPAYRLRAVDGNGAPTGITYPDSAAPPKLTVVGARELPRPALAFLGEPVPGADAVAAPDPVVTGIHEAAAPGADRSLRPDDAYAAAGRPPAVRDEWTPGPPVDLHGPYRGDGSAREQARRRRRDTLAVLAVAFAVALLAAVVTGATAVWALCALDAVALVAYVSLLVHLRRMADERERKLHYLDVGDDRRPARVGRPRPYVSGRYAHPSSQRAVAH
jgi:hypothetical protein